VLSKPIVVLLAAASLASAVEVRVATFNIGAYFNVNGNPEYSLGDPGTPDHDKVRDVLDRIDADVVALQEIASADVTGSPDDLDALALSLGYPYLYVAPVTAAAPLPAPIDTSLRVAFLSRFPFLTTDAIRSPEGAKEVTRLHPVVKVDIPGTLQDPVLISAHLKAGSTLADRFRRAVDMMRLVGYLNAEGLTNDDNYIILGDFNFNPNYANATYTSVPTTQDMPGSYDLGDDLTFPLSYSINPLAYFTTPGVSRLDPRQLDGSPVTLPSGAGFAIDLMLVSPAIAGRPLESEVYNSSLDTTNITGLAKAGSPLADDTSTLASDHYAVFADLELDQELPNLDLTLSAAALDEGLPDGSVMVTVTLPATRPSAVTVTISSDDPGAIPVNPAVVIPAGSLSGGTAIRAPRNFIADPQRSITFTATASGYDPDNGVLQVNDVDGPYTFTSSGQTVTEGFGGFAGDHDPAPWVTTGGAWQGIDNGSSSVAGQRAYGSAADPSLGFLPSGSGSVATTTFVNQTPVVLTSLQIAFDVEQWRSASGGTADTLSAALHFNGQTLPLPALSHAASQSLPSGAVAGGLTTAKSATVSGLSIHPGGIFELRVTFTPGPGGGVAPADVFVNEFHYDDLGTDGNEFIEIVVAPGFTGTPADVDVIRYNGDMLDAAVTYGSPLNLATFAVGDVVAGYKLYSIALPVNGIENGDRDGFALIDKRNGQVLQLISYEGSFTAAPGSPAAGLISTAIPVLETTGGTPENSSLGLSGSGGVPGAFTWLVSSGSNTRGSANAGQTFVVPTLPSQGLAIDNLSVTATGSADFDQDGIADTMDPDDDNDGQTDADEAAFGTDPFNAASLFKPVLARAAIPANGFTLTFPGAVGITYVVETSTTLGGWSEVSTHPGSGQPIVVPLALAGPARFYRVRAGG
jgi:endonuclease/exonuclease/phosphatase family metal-dependent hydrolase